LLLSSLFHPTTHLSETQRVFQHPNLDSFSLSCSQTVLMLILICLLNKPAERIWYLLLNSLETITLNTVWAGFSLPSYSNKITKERSALWPLWSIIQNPSSDLKHHSLSLILFTKIIGSIKSYLKLFKYSSTSNKGEKIVFSTFTLWIKEHGGLEIESNFTKNNWKLSTVK